MDYITRRVVEEADFIISNGATVRDTAKIFEVSKSTVHKDVTERLKKINEKIYLKVREVLDKNLEERHVRGGEATKARYTNKGKDK